MTDRCPTGLNEKLITAFLDGELTQGDEQRVRLHLESCSYCRELYTDLRRIRDAAMSTRFPAPPDDQWDERPRTRGSLAFRLLGWWLAIPWVIFVLAYAAREAWLGSHGAAGRVLVFGGIAAGTLLLVSALLDRLRDLKTDKYRGVNK
ncbi:MAG: hypothetical protein GXP48_00410 [Acidobacteria bacterium]|nr:hypothetical protein [Acidobacteriota bacterium]